MCRWLKGRRGSNSLFGHGIDRMRVYRRGPPNFLLAFSNRFEATCVEYTADGHLGGAECLVSGALADRSES